MYFMVINSQSNLQESSFFQLILAEIVVFLFETLKSKKTDAKHFERKCLTEYQYILPEWIEKSIWKQMFLQLCRVRLELCRVPMEPDIIAKTP